MITLTNASIDHINKSHVNINADFVGYRFKLIPNGCSGYAYKIDRLTTKDDVDQHTKVFNGHIWNVFVPTEQLEQMEGMIVDYVRDGLNSGFSYINPNEKHRCGCGSSVIL